MQFDLVSAIPNLAIFMPAFLFAMCFHEFAHAWTAKRLGDNTAEQLGRLSMNPAVHIDVLGTLILPVVAIVTGAPLFGWAKPVPVNTRNLNNPSKDMFWVAIAGPLSNVILAILGFIALPLAAQFVPGFSGSHVAFRFLDTFIFFNMLLALFNMLPMHPLDGGKVLERFIPASWNRVLEEKQYFLNIALLILIFSGGFSYIVRPLRILQHYISYYLLSGF